MPSWDTTTELPCEVFNVTFYFYFLFHPKIEYIQGYIIFIKDEKTNKVNI